MPEIYRTSSGHQIILRDGARLEDNRYDNGMLSMAAALGMDASGYFISYNRKIEKSNGDVEYIGSGSNVETIAAVVGNLITKNKPCLIL